MAEEREELERLRMECSKIVVILPLDSEADVNEEDRRGITSICLESLMYVRRLQGRLENDTEHIKEAKPLRNGLK